MAARVLVVLGALLALVSASIPPPYLPGEVLLVGEFLIPAYNVTGSQRIYLSYNGGASLANARVDEIFTDTHTPPLPGVPRYDAGFVGANYSYYAWASPTGGLGCISESGILSIVPQQTWFLLFCQFNGTSDLEGVEANRWACFPSSSTTAIWYTGNLFGAFMRMEYYLNAQPQTPVLTVDWVSVTPYSNFAPTLFAPPAAWNCSSSATAQRPRAVGALDLAIKLATKPSLLF